MKQPSRRVLVTRPEPGASRTAARLRAMGFDPLQLPLHGILALRVDREAMPPGIAAVAVTSANATRHARKGLLQPWLDKPCYAVGGATANAAREAGFRTVMEGGGDASALAGMIIRDAPAGPVAYLCGRVRRPQFEALLGAAGVVVAPIETYDTVGIPPSNGDPDAILGTEPVGFALVYSGHAAAELDKLVKVSKGASLFRETRFLCISERVAEPLKAAGRRSLVSAEPNETSLLSLLRSLGKEAS